MRWPLQAAAANGPRNLGLRSGGVNIREIEPRLARERSQFGGVKFGQDDESMTLNALGDTELGLRVT
jgi:hypothetical protein